MPLNLAVLGAGGKLYDDQIPANIARLTDVTAAVAASGVTPAIVAQLDTTEWIWHTRTGGGLTAAIDPLGTYPPHPVTTRMLLFANPNVKPLSNGSRVTGGGGMDISYPADSWMGPA